MQPVFSGSFWTVGLTVECYSYWEKMISVLFVCLGNICRSVTAEEVFRTLAKSAGRESDFEIDSAGLIDYHAGELADSRMRSHAARHGYRLTHRSRPVVAGDFRRFDCIVAMDEQNVKGLAALAPSADALRKVVRMADFLQEHPHSYIPDPYYGTAEDFELVIELLEDACRGLLAKL